MSQERTVNDLIESITNGLVYIAKNGSDEDKENAMIIMEEGWRKCDDFDFNKELIKLWKESHKENKETKP